MEMMTTNRALFPRPRPLGETLRILGLVTADEIDGLLERQELEGGRLGTCLLDTGLLDEDTLLAALGAQLRIPTAGAGVLAAVDSSIARLLPARAAVQTGSVPLARNGRELEVAMIDPTSLAALDDLWRVTGMEIRPRLALEIRVAEAQERLYGSPLNERLARTRRRIATRLELRRERQASPAPAA